MSNLDNKKNLSEQNEKEKEKKTKETALDAQEEMDRDDETVCSADFPSGCI